MPIRTKRTIALLGFAPLGLAPIACSDADPQPLKPVERVLLISIDTLRADHLGAYGASLPTSPNIDTLAQRAAVFRHAVSSNPLTLPSHATLLTGANPPSHGVHDNSTYRLGDVRKTLADIVSARGFRTAAVIGAVVLDRRYGLARGFQTYDDQIEAQRTAGGELGFVERNATQVTDRAIGMLRENAGEGFLLFVHYYDPHRDWNPPSDWKVRFPDNGYAAEIAYTDAQVGRLLAELASLGIDESTAVVLTSDHGESLGAFGELSHSYFIYQVTQAVPLIVHVPGMQRRLDVEPVVGLVDVAPTVLGLLGIATDPAMEGRDLAVHWRGGEPERPAGSRNTEHVVYAESLTPTKLDCNPMFAAVTDRWKYIHTRRPELYDLEADPAEQNNLFEREPEVAQKLREALEQLVVGGAVRTERHELDSATQLQLEQLGYLGSRVDDRLEIDATRPDPKDCLKWFDLYAALVLNARIGDWDATRSLAQQLLDERPDLADAYRYLGLAAIEARKWSEAHSHLRLYLALVEADGTTLSATGAGTSRQRAEAYTALARVLRELGRESEAAAVAQIGEALAAP